MTVMIVTQNQGIHSMLHLAKGIFYFTVTCATLYNTASESW